MAKDGLPKSGLKDDIKPLKPKKQDDTKRIMRVAIAKARRSNAAKKAAATRKQKAVATRKQKAAADGFTPNVVGSELKSVVSETKKTRFDKLVDKVMKLDDVKVLKKMIYNRNYRIKQKFIKDNPAADVVKDTEILVNDIRHIKKSTWNRIMSIKDKDKLVDTLRKIIIDNTRRRNVPKVIGDYSNRERDYIANGVESLKMALANWQDDKLKVKLERAFDNITMTDMNNIYSKIPSYWAISEGYYYAVSDFNEFMNHLYALIERELGPDGKPLVKLTRAERAELEDRLFKNDPRQFSGK